MKGSAADSQEDERVTTPAALLRETLVFKHLVNPIYTTSRNITITTV